MTTAQKFLDEVNAKYVKLHKNYESLFWTVYMGDKSAGDRKNKALAAIDAFKGSARLREEAVLLQSKANPKLKERLQTWVDFFGQYQMSEEATLIKSEIASLETKIEKKRSGKVSGYIDPSTNKFVETSVLKMRAMIQTHPDEGVRKACYVSREEMAFDCLDEYVELIKLRNKFAVVMGYADFYDYKLRSIDKMTKKELFSLFEEITDKTSGRFEQIRDLEKSRPGLRQPWNFGYFMSGDFTKEEDPYFQFDQALSRWGRSFAASGIDFKQGKLQLDLMDRKGKWNNGFCHWPDLVHFENGKRVSGSANFTCNVVPGQVGSGSTGYMTLFHEGGHAAHFLNVEQKDVCLNHEYAPMTAAWAETHSMFIDTMFSSIEWKQRYAKNSDGGVYPFELFEKKVNKLNLLAPSGIMSIIFVCTFEREVYELNDPTAEKIVEIAKRNHLKFFDLKEGSLMALTIPHIYAWESTCAYHGYGLATIALSQWREYFYKKYGYIVDNPKVGKEMKATWQWGSSKSFAECVKEATGKKLSSQSLIRSITMSPAQVIKLAKKKLKTMESVKEYKKEVDLKAEIKMVHGTKLIANNKKGFEVMAQKYAKWVKELETSN